MKPVFKCEYCSEIGTEEEIKEHEPKCRYNYNLKSCNTCTHKIFKNSKKGFAYECKKGRDIPEGQMYKDCELYEFKTNTHLFSEFADCLFGWK